MAAQCSSRDQVSECRGEHRMETPWYEHRRPTDVPSSVEWPEQPSKRRPDMPILIVTTY